MIIVFFFLSILSILMLEWLGYAPGQKMWAITLNPANKYYAFFYLIISVPFLLLVAIGLLKVKKH